MILNEGGNVFANAEPFDHKDVTEILRVINNALNDTGIQAIPVGSAATPRPGQQSGDMDVIVDEASVLEYFKAKDAKSGRKALNDFIQQQGLETAQSGINVHVNVPVGQQHHQVDIMVTANAPTVAKFHTHNIPANSPYKGVNKQLILAMLAKQKGYMWSAWQGLFDRNEQGKKGNFVSDDLDTIANVLLGKGTSSKDLGSVEAILGALPPDIAEPLLDRARQDPNWVEKKQIESIELTRIQELAGVPQDSPSSSTVNAPPDVLKQIGSKMKKNGMPNLTPVKPPPMPTGQLQAGQRLETNPDGTIMYSSGQGIYTYDKAGKPLKYSSPTFAGITQTNDLVSGNISVRYHVGPIDMTLNFDKAGKSLDSEKLQYDLGIGVVGHDRSNGITATTWQDRGDNVIQSRNMVKDPAAYDRAMAQVNASAAKRPTTESRFRKELEAMLVVARLR
jgi:hypothetical protein